MLFTHLLMVALEVPALETVLQGGGRNQALFDAVRFAVYGWRHGANLEAWNRRVREHALEQNECFRDPLSAGEVQHTADSISTWIWSRPHLDHSRQAQAWRGRRSGRSRRKKTQDRDQAIVQDWLCSGSSAAPAPSGAREAVPGRGKGFFFTPKIRREPIVLRAE